MSFIYNGNKTGPRTEPCGTPDETHVLSHKALLTETLCSMQKIIMIFSSFGCFQLFYRRLI